MRVPHIRFSLPRHRRHLSSLPFPVWRQFPAFSIIFGLNFPYSSRKKKKKNLAGMACLLTLDGKSKLHWLVLGPSWRRRNGYFGSRRTSQHHFAAGRKAPMGLFWGYISILFIWSIYQPGDWTNLASWIPFSWIIIFRCLGKLGFLSTAGFPPCTVPSIANINSASILFVETCAHESDTNPPMHITRFVDLVDQEVSLCSSVKVVINGLGAD